MAPRSSMRKSNPDRMEYSFWLVFGADGSMRFSRTQPGLSAGERRMSCSAELPMILFRTPELKATIEVASPAAAAEFRIDAKAAAEALAGAIGCDVDLKINNP